MGASGRPWHCFQCAKLRNYQEKKSKKAFFFPFSAEKSLSSSESDYFLRFFFSILSSIL